MKKIISTILALVMLVSLIPMAFAAAISNSLVLPFADFEEGSIDAEVDAMNDPTCKDYTFYIYLGMEKDAYTPEDLAAEFGDYAGVEFRYLLDLYYDMYDPNNAALNKKAHDAVYNYINLAYLNGRFEDKPLFDDLAALGVVKQGADCTVKSNWPTALQKYRPMESKTSGDTTTPPPVTSQPPVESTPSVTTAEPTPDSTYATEVDKNGNPMSKDEIKSIASDAGTYTTTFVGKNNENNLPVYQRVASDGYITYVSIVNGFPSYVSVVKDGMVPGTDTTIYRYDVTFSDGKNRYFTRSADYKAIPYDKVLPTFTDVHETDWFYEAVTAMADNGIVNGYGNGTFQPNKPLTIGEMAALICRIDSTVNVLSFDEVKAKDGGNGMKSPNYGERDWDAPTSWAHDYIWAVWEGGYTHWDPEAYDVPVMRGEAMKIAVEFATRMQAYSDINWRDNGTWYPTRQAERTHVIKDYDSIQYMIPDFFPSAISYDEKEVLGTVSGTYSNGTQKGARHGIEFNRPSDVALTGTNYSGWEFMPCDCSDYDLNEHFWTAGDVLVAYQLGIVHGVDTAGTSGAHNSITRAEFCQMLYNMGIKDTQTVNCWYVTKPEGGAHTGLKENGEEVLERSQGVPPTHF